jgi:protein-S-isoprenylcysteine O-methyltransferase Ste14
LMFAGVGPGLGNALSLVACFVLPTIGYIQRIPREEKLLRHELGEPYIEYASEHRRLVPGVTEFRTSPLELSLLEEDRKLRRSEERGA